MNQEELYKQFNRPLTFRVWHNKKKEWVHGPGYECNLFGEMILLCEFMRGVSITDLNDCYALQYIGLKDKNGKDIYEGDILKAYLANDDREVIGKVVFDPYKGWFIDNNAILFDEILYDGGIVFHQAEIIGNVFENPELI